jgi:trans-aconitate 2-methyltransferase
MPREWNGNAYDRIADPMTRWGSAVLDRLPLAGDETVLDAGCGSGRVTEQLLGRLPDGCVIALDASQSMLDAARERLAGALDRVTFLRADLTHPIPIETPVDAVFSTATFHWVLDHDALFANLSAALRPGGRLVAQCGGFGNLASVLAAVAEVDTSGYRPWTFATPEETRARLEASGFADIDVWLHDEPTDIPAEDLETYLAEVVLGATLERMPAEQREPFVQAVVSRMPSPRLDYVRLNIVATKA